MERRKFLLDRSSLQLCKHEKIDKFISTQSIFYFERKYKWMAYNVFYKSKTAQAKLSMIILLIHLDVKHQSHKWNS